MKTFFFRNLDGVGTLINFVDGADFRGKTILNRSVMVSSVGLGGTVLQNYTFELSLEGNVFYKGNSSFGFFPEKALVTQTGLDDGDQIAPWFSREGLAESEYVRINLDSPFGKMRLFKAPEGKPHYRLATGQLALVDKLIIAKDRGQYNLGYIHATKFIKPYEWFFSCHFYQDPIMPGSIGIEAILQAMQVFAIQQDKGRDFKSPKFTHPDNCTTSWKYRGQILSDVKEMHLEVHVKSLKHQAGKLEMVADAFVWNDQTRIYKVTDLGLAIVES